MKLDDSKRFLSDSSVLDANDRALGNEIIADSVDNLSVAFEFVENKTVTNESWENRFLIDEF